MPAVETATPRGEVEERLKRLSAWQQRLLGAVRVKDLLVLLSDFGIRDEDVAAAVPSASLRTVRRWRTEGPPSTKAATRWQQLDDLRSIVGFLLVDGTYDEDGIVAWLRSRHVDLDLRRPLDMLGEGRFDKVLAAAERSLASRPSATDDPIHPTEPAGPEAVVERAKAR